MFCRPSFQSIDLLQSTPPFSAEEARIQPKTISVGLIRTCHSTLNFVRSLTVSIQGRPVEFTARLTSQKACIHLLERSKL